MTICGRFDEIRPQIVVMSAICGRFDEIRPQIVVMSADRPTGFRLHRRTVAGWK